MSIADGVPQRDKCLNGPDKARARRAGSGPGFDAPRGGSDHAQRVCQGRTLTVICLQVIAALSVSLGSMVVGFASGYTAPALASMERNNETMSFTVSEEEVSVSFKCESNTR